MSYYEDVYMKRVNRFGNDPQSRIVGQRVKVFEDLLVKSIYRVDFVYKGVMEPGLLERYKQDESQTFQYLLTRLTLKLNGGDLLEITDQDGRTKTWMVFWLEYIEASGYNKYVLLDTNYTISWTRELGKTNPTYYSSLCYFFGKKRVRLKDDHYEGGSLYLEDSNNYTLILPFNENLEKGDYFEIKKGNKVFPFTVSEFDAISTDGIEYVTVLPAYEYNKEVMPTEPTTTGLLQAANNSSQSTEYDWFTGDFKED